MRGIELDGRVQGHGDNFNEYLNWLGLRISGFKNAGAFEMDTAASISLSKAALKDINLQIGAMNAKGQLALFAGGLRPKLEASLDFDALDLDSYERAEVAAAGSANSKPDFWSEKPFEFGDLQRLDASLHLTAKSSTIRGVKSGITQLDVELKDAALAAALTAKSALSWWRPARFSPPRSFATPPPWRRRARLVIPCPPSAA